MSATRTSRPPAAGTVPVATRPARPARPARTHRWTRKQRSTALAFALLAPALVAMVLMRVLPMITAITQSLQHLSLSQGETTFAGLKNYAFLLKDANFHSVLLITLVFNLILNPVIVVASTALALLLSKRIPWVGLWRSLVFVPAAVPGVVVALIWSTALQPDGLVNAVLQTLGLPPQPFLTSSHQALFSIGIMVTWGALGYWMIFIIAGLKDIPDSLYEAAMIDGAGWWRRLVSITLPLLRRPMSFVLIGCTVGSFLIFAPIQMLTKGGPNGSTNLIMYDIYNNAYQIGDLGVGQAEVVVLMVILAAIVAVQFRLMREDKA